jgi:hypothetical protein
MSKNKFHSHDIFNCFLILTLLLLISCGGGGSVAGGGIGGTGVIAYGPVTAKGSIFVNGVEYDTSSAQVILNGTVQADDSGLRRGMGVEVEGEFNSDRTTGSALIVNYEDIVKGPVKNLTSSSSFITMEVLGQTVIFEQGNTLIDDGAGNVTEDLSSITNGDVIEVSGQRDEFAANGVIRASYIKEEFSFPTTYKVYGFIENDNLAQYQIAGLTVVAASAQDRNGTYVKVEGPDSVFNATTDTLTTNTIILKAPGLSIVDKDNAEMEGIINSYLGDTTGGTMTVNGQDVSYDATTVFEGGMATDLANGIKIEAEGPLSNGTLVADKIQFKDNIKIRANVSTTGPTITLEGLSGIVIVADTSTEFDEPLMTSLNDLLQYDHIEVRGREVSGPGTRTVFAKRIKVRKDAPADPTDRETQVELQGLVDSFNAASTQIVILDVVIDTSTISDNNFTQNNGSYLGETDFFSSLTTNPDPVVDMNGTLNTTNSQVAWDQVELESDL